MDATAQNPRVIVVGDVADDLFRRIVAPLPTPSEVVAWQGALPESWPADPGDVDVVVLHLPVLGSLDLGRLTRYFGRAPVRPRVVLCTGGLARYQALERWATVCDRILFEATAPEVIARYVQHDPAQSRNTRPPADVQRRQATASVVVSANYEMRLMLTDACRRAGFPTRPAGDWDEAPAASLAIWDVPVLDAGWPLLLRRESRRRRVVALAGFCERSLVGALYANGARACLDLPCDPEDLTWVLDRVATEDATQYSAHEAHAVPPRANALASERPAPTVRRGQGGRSPLQ